MLFGACIVAMFHMAFFNRPWPGLVLVLGTINLTQDWQVNSLFILVLVCEIMEVMREFDKWFLGK